MGGNRGRNPEKNRGRYDGVLAPGRLKVIREHGSLRSVLPPQMRKMMSTATRAHGRLPDEPVATESPLGADEDALSPPSGRR